jgi:hypothetical protein
MRQEANVFQQNPNYQPANSGPNSEPETPNAKLRILELEPLLYRSCEQSAEPLEVHIAAANQHADSLSL